jgi:hypothetical protein
MEYVSDLRELYSETHEAYYWMGFLIADGTFYERGIKLHLSNRDQDHLNKFKEFVSYKGTSQSNSVYVTHPVYVPMIRQKFDIQDRKTYNPCDLSKHTADMLFSLIIGLIDGDGSMRKRQGSVSAIEVKMHQSWLKQLEFVGAFLHDSLDVERTFDTNLARLRTDGYALLLLTNRSLLAEMKNKSIQLHLPMMERKWDAVDNNYLSRIQESELLRRQVHDLKSQGMTLRAISNELNINYTKTKYLSRT